MHVRAKCPLVVLAAGFVAALLGNGSLRAQLAHFPLDGDLFDVEGAHDGVFFGADAPLYVTGFDGTEEGAVLLDGVDDFIEVPDDLSELALSSPFTLALWFRATSTAQSQKYLLSRNAPGAQYAIIYEYTDDRVDFFAPSRLFGDDPRAGGRCEMPVTDTAWHHIAYTYDGVIFTGYVDGEVVVEFEIDFALSDAFLSSWYIGAANPTVNHTAGAFDDVRIYDEPLDEDEIAELASGGVGVECPDEGDTHCRGLEATGPDGEVAGDWTIVADGVDDSGDDILYTFRAEGPNGAVIQRGPQAEDTALLGLRAGTWSVTVSVDDDAACPDAADDASCTVELVVGSPPPSLVAHWPLDGDLLDAARSHDGTFFGDVEPLFGEGYDGTPNGAIVLDGIDDFVEVLEEPDIVLTTAFTLALWFRSDDSLQTQKYLLSKNGGGGQYAIIFEYTNDRVDFYAPSRGFGPDPRAGAMSEMPITDTEWHHVAYSYDGTTWAGYIDGVQVFAHEIEFGLSDAFRSNWYIGAANPTVNFVAGAIDDVRIYDYGLTAEEILELTGLENPCPDDGDTHVVEFEALEGADDIFGRYELVADAVDDSGDEIGYTFRARRGDGAPHVSGPGIEDAAVFDLGYGTWSFSVTVDDDPLCPDAALDATAELEVRVPAERGLVAHWPLDGSLEDEIGVNDGVFFGDVEPLWSEGFDGTEEGALAFDGIDDFVEILEAPELKLSDEFTMALWFRSADTSQSQKYLLSKNGGGGQYAIIYEYTDDRLDFFAPSRLFGDDPRAGGASEMPLADTEWHHIAYTYDGSTWTGYLDGEAVISLDIAFALSDGFASSWFIGAANPLVNHVAGDIDDVRLYSRGLSSEEIAALAEGSASGARFTRGDADASGAINITDGIFVLNFLFLGGAAPGCADAADADDSGAINITDGIYVLNFLFLGGAAPPAPHPGCGEDAEGDADGVDCAVSHDLGACLNAR